MPQKTSAKIFLAVGLLAAMFSLHQFSRKNAPPARDPVAYVPSAPVELPAAEPNKARKTVVDLKPSAVPMAELEEVEDEQVHARANQAEVDKLTREWDERLARHDDSPVDQDFSSQVEPIIEKDLADLSQLAGGFEVVSVECRSKSCKAEMLWDDYPSASQNFQPLLLNGYGIDCRTDILLPRPDDAEAAYEGSFLMHCDRGTAGIRKPTGQGG